MKNGHTKTGKNDLKRDVNANKVKNKGDGKQGKCVAEKKQVCSQILVVLYCTCGFKMLSFCSKPRFTYVQYNDQQCHLESCECNFLHVLNLDSLAYMLSVFFLLFA